jgi:hypothetical protein
MLRTADSSPEYRYRKGRDSMRKWDEITLLDIIQRPVFYLKPDISETGFGLYSLVEPTQLDPVDRASRSGDRH